MNEIMTVVVIVLMLLQAVAVVAICLFFAITEYKAGRHRFSNLHAAVYSKPTSVKPTSVLPKKENNV